ncbi:hypothetical protein ACTXK7_07130 [Vreelandella alkaliphila]
MTLDRLESIALFFDITSDAVAEKQMECLDAASIVSMQLQSAGIPHAFIRGSVTNRSSVNTVILVPHYYIEVSLGDDCLIIDTSLVTWFSEEVDAGLPLVFRKECVNADHSLYYEKHSDALVDRNNCSFLLEIAESHPIPPSLLKCQ